MNMDIEKMKDSIEIQIINGVPNPSKKENLSTWNKFICTVVPWLREKQIQGERLLEAQVRKAESDANKTAAEAYRILSEANLNIEKAKEIAIGVKIKEQEFLDHRKTHYSANEVAIQLEKISALLNDMSSIHGTRFEIDAKKDGTSTQVE